ncbi:molybdenum ABC transporter ATP-binding protein [Blastochloris viridis]|uniref:Molybdenum transport ATP-binding protein ModC n=1 Tax=Blastochloris viridis TaxID=1079 RepID=A0A0H5BNU1_BLAVI|nr:molybdenum ABC transporter ATP-binding protein [Blastochloris viridis]ALK08488.1 Sulfate/thiosulfate import ATP-binding protein CysA [Blastochloris viridis]BAR98228.1 molybdenum transport ATP-binding protein ModC [Blastochloris viridis]CUU41150.1 Sulfate/thiosulfate import ATP-binding protein CysA [Blastochloris viridis]
MIRFDCSHGQGDFSLNVAFEAESGVTALFGPSGSGKSTVIRLLAGLARPQRGHIEVDGTVLLDTTAGINLKPHRRRLGLVFQDAQLFPHLKVRTNLGYGRFFTCAADRVVSFEPVVEVLGIAHLLDRYPATLSGGERQRVAIGRALLTSPRLLLMDEPLASLDADRKLEVLPFIERLRDEFAIPIVYVSHAVEEVARLAARVVKIVGGKVATVGTPSEVLAPNLLASASERFDAVSVISGHVVRYDPDFAVTIVRHPAGEIVVPGRIDNGHAPVRITIRSTNVTLAVGRPGQVSVRTILFGTVERVETDGGPFALVVIALVGGDRLYAFATRLALDSLGLDAGDEVHALIKSVSIDERAVPRLVHSQPPTT